MNKEISGTDVYFLENPSNGDKKKIFKWIFVKSPAGRRYLSHGRTPEPISKLDEQLPEIYDPVY